MPSPNKYLIALFKVRGMGSYTMLSRNRRVVLTRHRQIRVDSADFDLLKSDFESFPTGGSTAVSDWIESG